MAATDVRPTSEGESRKVAEESREQEWSGRTFLRELFLGNFLLDHIHPFPVVREERPEFRRFYDALEPESFKTRSLLATRAKERSAAEAS